MAPNCCAALSAYARNKGALRVVQGAGESSKRLGLSGRRRRIGREEAARRSDSNLRLQLATEPAERKGMTHSFGSGVHPNPRLRKHRWKIFVVGPEDHRVGSMKRWTLAMPEIGHAEFLRRARWLKDNGIQWAVINRSQRREHELWSADVAKREKLAPSYDDDPDEVAGDGHR